MPKVSAENPKRFKTLKKNQAKNCSSAHAEGSFDNFLKFFDQKSEKIFAQILRKFWKEIKKKNYFFRNFYSGHVDGNLRTMPKVSVENPKLFKNFLKNFEATSCSCGHAEVSFHNFLKIWPKVWKIFAQKSKKILKRKQKKLFFPQFLLWTRI